MKIAIFSDIHGNYQALETILSDIKKKNIDKVICLGDVIGLGPCSNECMHLINENKILLLAGNHELYYTKGVDVGYIVNPDILLHNEWVHKTMTEKVDDSHLFYELKTNNKKLLFVHYFLNNNKYPFESSSLFEDDSYKELFKKYDYDYVFYGHRHEERIDEKDGKVLYGLGSSGCTKDDITFYYLIDTTKDVNVTRIDLKYDRKKFLKLIEEVDFPTKEHICDYFYGIKNAK